MKMEPIERSETSAIRTKTSGNYPNDNICMRRLNLLLFDADLLFLFPNDVCVVFP